MISIHKWSLDHNSDTQSITIIHKNHGDLVPLYYKCLAIYNKTNLYQVLVFPRDTWINLLYKEMIEYNL